VEGRGSWREKMDETEDATTAFVAIEIGLATLTMTEMRLQFR